MEILLTIILALFLYFAVKVGYRLFLFYRKYKSVINQFRDAQSAANNAYRSASATQQTTDNVQTGGTNQKKKIIPQDEGEYVEFEEVS